MAKKNKGNKKSFFGTLSILAVISTCVAVAVVSNSSSSFVPGTAIVDDGAINNHGMGLNASRLKFKSIGDVFTLNATLSPSNATNRELIWTTSDSSKIAINPDGETCSLTRVSDFSDEVIVRVASRANSAIYAECSVSCYNGIVEIGDYYLTNYAYVLSPDDTEDVYTEFPGITEDVTTLELNVETAIINKNYESRDLESLLDQLNTQADGLIEFSYASEDPTDYSTTYVTGRAVAFNMIYSETFETCDFSLTLDTMSESFNFTLEKYIEVENIELDNSSIVL